ncbi:hypothetical protein [Flavobacterium sp. N2820]|uniref:hypothetical protein n=1 Tax=Flavobacterium sp. N2820 TaxID=2986834 RepID=UPI0022254987|nr:hypothetical protein [Flavobacterium sp. N2820]
MIKGNCKRFFKFTLPITGKVTYENLEICKINCPEASVGDLIIFDKKSIYDYKSKIIIITKRGRIKSKDDSIRCATNTIKFSENKKYIELIQIQYRVEKFIFFENKIEKEIIASFLNINIPDEHSILIENDTISEEQFQLKYTKIKPTI